MDYDLAHHASVDQIHLATCLVVLDNLAFPVEASVLELGCHPFPSLSFVAAIEMTGLGWASAAASYGALDWDPDYDGLVAARIGSDAYSPTLLETIDRAESFPIWTAKDWASSE